MLETKQKLADNLDVRWIDLSQKKVAKLKRLKPLILNYDLKFGSSVIWGNPNVLDNIPPFEPHHITLIDAEILYFTRMYAFLGSLNDDAFSNGLEAESARFFRNQMAKAILALVDTLLIQTKSYDSSYRRRVANFAEQYPQKKELVELSTWALDEKMNPKDPAMGAEDVTSLYQQVLTLYRTEMFVALSKLYKREIRSTDKLVRAKSFSVREMVLAFKVIVLSRSLKSHTRHQNIQYLQSYAAEYFLASKTQKTSLLAKCKELVGKIQAEQSEQKVTEHNLREIVVKLSRAE